MRLYMRIPVFLPAVTFSTELTLKWLHTQMFIHMLPKIPSFIETLVAPVIAHFSIPYKKGTGTLFFNGS